MRSASRYEGLHSLNHSIQDQFPLLCLQILWCLPLHADCHLMCVALTPPLLSPARSLCPQVFDWDLMWEPETESDSCFPRSSWINCSARPLWAPWPACTDAPWGCIAPASLEKSWSSWSSIHQQGLYLWGPPTLALILQNPRELLAWGRKRVQKLDRECFSSCRIKHCALVDPDLYFFVFCDYFPRHSSATEQINSTATICVSHRFGENDIRAMYRRAITSRCFLVQRSHLHPKHSEWWVILSHQSYSVSVLQGLHSQHGSHGLNTGKCPDKPGVLLRLMSPHKSSSASCCHLQAGGHADSSQQSFHCLNYSCCVKVRWDRTYVSHK